MREHRHNAGNQLVPIQHLNSKEENHVKSVTSAETKEKLAFTKKHTQSTIQMRRNWTFAQSQVGDQLLFAAQKFIAKSCLDAIDGVSELRQEARL